MLQRKNRKEADIALRNASNTNYPVTLIEKIVLYLVVVTFFTDIKVNYYALIALSLLWLYHKRYKLSLEILRNSPIFIALCIYIAFLILSFTYTNNYSYGLKAIEKKSSLILLPILLTGIPWNNSLRSEIFKLFVLSIFILTVYSIITTLIKFKIGSDMSYFSWVLPLTSSLSANYYSLFVAFAILILIFEFKQFQLILPTPLLIVLIFYLGAFLALLSSRASMAGVLLVLIVFAANKIFRHPGKERSKGIMVLSLTLLMFIIVFSTVPYLNSRVKQSIFHFTMDPRYQLLKSNVRVFLKSPILGAGIGDVQDESVKEYIQANNVEAYTNKYNAHNEWLQVLLTTGTVGFIIFLNFFLRLVKKAWLSKDLYMISFLIFYVVVSMTESILERNKGVVFFSFFVTFFFILKNPGETLLDTKTTSYRKTREI